MDIGALLKVIPESTVSGFIDNLVDAEIGKASAALKTLIKEGLDKAYGTSIATASPAAPASPISTSAAEK